MGTKCTLFDASDIIAVIHFAESKSRPCRTPINYSVRELYKSITPCSFEHGERLRGESESLLCDYNKPLKDFFLDRLNAENVPNV